MTQGTTDRADSLKIRQLHDDDREAVIELDGTAFLGMAPRDLLESVVIPTLEMSRFTGVFDGDDLVGVTGIFSKNITCPGGRVTPFAGVTWVGVQPGHTGRGILRRLMTNQLHGLHDQGLEPIALLTASESGIYGRFGYGLASRIASFHIPRGVAFINPVPRGTVKQVSRETAWPVIKEQHAKVGAHSNGYLTRSPEVWEVLYSDHEFARAGASPLQFALHQDGFISFRTKAKYGDRGPEGELTVHEICAGSPEASAALWRHVLDYSLIREIVYTRGNVDDPIQDLVVDPRAIRTSTRDHLWLRIVDLERTIPLRSYSAPADVVVQVVDDLCPWNDGVWAFALGATGGTAVGSTREPQLTVSITDLGAAFLGGFRLARFAAAGRIVGDRAAIAALDLAFSTPLAPWSPEGF